VTRASVRRDNYDCSEHIKETQTAREGTVETEPPEEGAVNQEASQPLPFHESLLQAVFAGGGFRHAKSALPRRNRASNWQQTHGSIQLLRTRF
jgi:hypothetical protein